MRIPVKGLPDQKGKIFLIERDEKSLKRTNRKSFRGTNNSSYLARALADTIAFTRIAENEGGYSKVPSVLVVENNHIVVGMLKSYERIGEGPRSEYPYGDNTTVQINHDYRESPSENGFLSRIIRDNWSGVNYLSYGSQQVMYLDLAGHIKSMLHLARKFFDIILISGDGWNIDITEQLPDSAQIYHVTDSWKDKQHSSKEINRSNSGLTVKSPQVTLVRSIKESRDLSLHKENTDLIILYHRNSEYSVLDKHQSRSILSRAFLQRIVRHMLTLNDDSDQHIPYPSVPNSLKGGYHRFAREIKNTGQGLGAIGITSTGGGIIGSAYLESFMAFPLIGGTVLFGISIVTSRKTESINNRGSSHDDKPQALLAYESLVIKKCLHRDGTGVLPGYKEIPPSSLVVTQQDSRGEPKPIKQAKKPAGEILDIEIGLGRPKFLRRRNKKENNRSTSQNETLSAPIPPVPLLPLNKDLISRKINELEDKWAEYELDPLLFLEFPLMSDSSCPETVEFHYSYNTLQQMNKAYEDNEVSLEDLRATLMEAEKSFIKAEYKAKKVRLSQFDVPQKRKIKTARSLLSIATDESSSPNERISAWKKTNDELEGLIHLPDTAVRGLLEAGAGAR